MTANTDRSLGGKLMNTIILLELNEGMSVDDNIHCAFVERKRRPCIEKMTYFRFL